MRVHRLHQIIVALKKLSQITVVNTAPLDLKMTSNFTPVFIIRKRLNKLKISDFSRTHEKTHIIGQTFTPKLL